MEVDVQCDAYEDNMQSVSSVYFEERSLKAAEHCDSYEDNMKWCSGDQFEVSVREDDGPGCSSGNIVKGGLVSVSAGDDAPYVGMIVRDVIEAFVLYSNYARRTGFEIRFRSSERKRQDAKEVV